MGVIINPDTPIYALYRIIFQVVGSILGNEYELSIMGEVNWSPRVGQ